MKGGRQGRKEEIRGGEKGEKPGEKNMGKWGKQMSEESGIKRGLKSRKTKNGSREIRKKEKGEKLVVSESWVKLERKEKKKLSYGQKKNKRWEGGEKKNNEE